MSSHVMSFVVPPPELPEPLLPDPEPPLARAAAGTRRRPRAAGAARPRVARGAGRGALDLPLAVLADDLDLGGALDGVLLEVPDLLVRVQGVGAAAGQRHVGRHTGRRVHDLELHDLAGVVEVRGVGHAQVEQLELGARGVLREVDDDLVALGHADPQLRGGLHLRHQAAVRTDHADRCAVAHLQPVAAGDRRVEHPEAVLALVDLEVRPRHAVDQDDVAPQAGVARVVVAELAVRAEHLVRQDERQVELLGDAVRGERLAAELPLRDAQALLDVVVQVVLRGQAHVGVLGGVVHAVVVVPERPGVLLVRVDVPLGLADLRDVAGVPVVLRLRRRAVQVRRGPRVVVEERVHGRQLVRLHHRERRAALGVDRRAGRGRHRRVFPSAKA